VASGVVEENIGVIFEVHYFELLPAIGLASASQTPGVHWLQSLKFGILIILGCLVLMGTP
jgi:hypothetical protein